MKFFLISFSYLCLFCLGLIDNSRGALYPSILDSFNISNSLGSLIFSLASLATLIATVLSKNWLRYFGVIRASHLGLILYFIGCFTMWLSAQIDYNFYLFLLGSLIFGFGLGIHGITLNSIISSSVSDQFKRRVFSGLHSMYGVASFLAPWFVKSFERYGLGWNHYFLGIGILPLVTSLFFIKTLKQHAHVPQQEFVKFNKKIAIFVIVFSFYVTAEILISSRLVIYLNVSEKFTLSDANFYLSSFFGLLLLGRIIFSFIRINLPNILLLKASLICTSFLVIFGMSLDPIFLIFTGLSMSFFFPSGMDYLSSIYQDKVDGVLSYVMIGVGCCLVFNHFVFGQVTNFIGIRYAFGTIPVFLLLSLYFLHFSLKKNRHPLTI